MLTLAMLQSGILQHPALPPHFVTAERSLADAHNHHSKGRVPRRQASQRDTLSFGRGSPLSRRQQRHYQQLCHGSM